MRPWLITPAERRLVFLLLVLAVMGAVGKRFQHPSSEVAAWLRQPDASGPSGARGPDPRTTTPPATEPERPAAEPSLATASSPPGSPSRPPPEAPPGGGSVDPNRAGVEELVALPGIGPALAARIVADRTARGPYRTPEDLLRVPGIGPATLVRIRDRLRFAPAAGG